MLPAARCLVPLHLHPHATIPCSWPRRRAPAPTVVSAKPRRRGGRGPHRDSSWDSDSDSDIDDGFFGDEQYIDEEPDQDDDPPPPRREASPEPQLRGTDVLRALQRAAAAKEASKKEKKGKRPAARLRLQGKEKVGEAEVAGEARPVVVRPEWAARIQELELRVRQLADKYHHHL